MNNDVDDLDELELIDQHELERGYSEGSHGGSDADSEEEGEEEEQEGEEIEALTDEQYDELKSTVVNIVTAMGGLEEIMGENDEVEMEYILGDDCLRCLRDLRKLWRQDEEDHHRVIPKIYAEVNVLQTGLLPLLLKSANMGEKGHKIALACTDLLTTITWPIDMVAERQAALQREDEDGNVMATYQILQTAFVSYKSAVLRTRSRETRGSQRSVLSSIMLLVLLPSLSKPRHNRSGRDIGTISMCLHLFRNLLAINDPMATSLSNLEDITNSKLQSELVVELHSSRILDAVLMISSNADTKDFNDWNVVVLECVYYMFIGTKPDDLADKDTIESGLGAQERTSRRHEGLSTLQSELARLSAIEAAERLEMQNLRGATRHSRFNTMITFVDRDGNKRMASGQAALGKTVEQLTKEADAKGMRVVRRRKAMQEKGAALRRAPWTSKARQVLSTWTEKFLKMGFESLTRSVLEDVRKERAKVGDLEVARTRIMQTGRFFLDYFLQQRQSSQDQVTRQDVLRSSNRGVESSVHAEGVDGERAEEMGEAMKETEAWPFSLISQWLEPWALRMAYVRCSSSFEKKQWLEYVAAIDLWTILFKVIEALSKSPQKESREAAEGIQMIHFYDQAALDSAKGVLSSYTSQSFDCLRAIVSFAYMMPKMLERYSKENEYMYVKAKQQVKKRMEKGNSLAEDEMQAKEIVNNEQKERRFEFEKFQGKMCSQHLADACLTYLSKWRELKGNGKAKEQIFNVTQVFHRLAIKAGDYRLFFPYKRRLLLQDIQADQLFWSFLRTEEAFPQLEKDLCRLIEFVLRKFNKMSAEEQGKWGQGMTVPRPIKVFKMPAEIEISPSRGHLDDVGIAVGLLLEKDKMKSIMWVKNGLEEAIRVKKAIIAEEKEKEREEQAEGRTGDDDDDDDDLIPVGALNRFADLDVSYTDDDELMSEASTSPEVKLLCRLLGLKSDESDSHRWVWTVAADALPNDLQKEADLVEDFLRRPLETFGETYGSLVQRTRKRSLYPAKQRKIVNEHGDEEEVVIKKQRGRKKEKNRPNTWVENDFIENSDEELEMIAKLMAARDGARGAVNAAAEEEEEDQSSTSTSSRRRPSPSSPPSSHTGTPQQRRKSRSTALFLGSDDERQEDGDEETNERHHTLTLRRPEPRPTKRNYVFSDDEAEEEERGQGRIGEIDQRDGEEAPSIRPAKRRTLISDDDDE
ncbi:hypothetical protein CBS101457_006347 [Exobasidium rhododendri]|nr:hypothetical protein CBS101457_006347 [Exobasidium rhododendri]